MADSTLVPTSPTPIPGPNAVALAAILFLIGSAVVVGLVDLVYFPQLPRTVNVSLAAVEAELLVAFAVGAEVWLSYLQHTKPPQVITVYVQPTTPPASQPAEEPPDD